MSYKESREMQQPRAAARIHPQTGESAEATNTFVEVLSTIAKALRTIEQCQQNTLIEQRSLHQLARELAEERSKWCQEIATGIQQVQTAQMRKEEMLKGVIQQLNCNNAAIAALMTLAEKQILPELESQADYAKQFVTVFAQWRKREADQWRVIASLAGEEWIPPN